MLFFTNITKVGFKKEVQALSPNLRMRLLAETTTNCEKKQAMPSQVKFGIAKPAYEYLLIKTN